MSNVIHVAPDEKFIDIALRDFERYSKYENRLYVISQGSELKHVKSNSAEIITEKKIFSNSLNDKFWYGVEILIFHSLCITNIQIPSNVKVIWLGFGYDYYDLIPSIKLLTPETMEIYKSNDGFTNYIKSIIKKMFMIEAKKKVKKNELIEKVDVFCPIISTEYDLIKWPSKNKPKLGDWAYGTIEDDWGLSFRRFISQGRFNECKGKIRVLIGNSANPTVNHINGINKLMGLNLNELEIIIPLSYGNKIYKSKLKKNIEAKKLKYDFIYLEDFLTFDEYMSKIMNCDIGIMPHKRQQGLGNIIGLLYCGAKVFLDRDNPLYAYFLSNGVKVFTIDEINEISVSLKLAEEEIIFNKEFVEKRWSREASHFRISELLRKIK